MDIESILNALGLDLTDPEAKRGALEAIDAILSSRQPDESAGGIPDGMSGEQEVEIDPDLLQPSIKNKPQASSDDIEVSDEEDVLKSVKHNESDDDEESPMSNDSETGDSDEETSAESETEQANDTEPDDYDDIDRSNGSDTTDADDDDTEEETEQDVSSGDDSETTEAEDDDEQSDDETSGSGGSGGGDDSEDDYDAEDGDSDGAEDDNDGDTGAEDDEGTDDGLEVDEDELLDDSIKDTYQDPQETAKQNARKIKRERTLQAAKTALADAKAKNKPRALIHELEQAIDALESLQEAVAKNIKDLSDEEFNLMVNRVFDAIDALGDSGLTYTSDEERQIRAKEIKADIENRQTQADLSAEDVAQIRAETQAIKAREREKAKYQKRSRNSFKGFQDFLNSLYRAIALQVHTEETQDDTWSAINRRYGGTGVLQQGKRINELPNRKIPVIDFYFDQSGSWDEDDIKVGEKAVAALADMEEKGQIKINIYYFANHVHSDAMSARAEGGTWAWNDIVKNVIATQATNVIIMTDSDMEDRWDYEGYWNGNIGKAAAYTVPGYVWYLWRDGTNAPRLPRDLKGRGGTQQFSFSSGGI